MTWSLKERQLARDCAKWFCDQHSIISYRVMFKTSPSPSRGHDTNLQHGVDLPDWDAVLKTESEDAVLFIAEYQPAPRTDPDPVLLVQSIGMLAKYIHHTIQPGKTPSFPKGMVYWNRDTFTNLGPLKSLLSQVNNNPEPPAMSHDIHSVDRDVLIEVMQRQLEDTAIILARVASIQNEIRHVLEALKQ